MVGGIALPGDMSGFYGDLMETYWHICVDELLVLLMVLYVSIISAATNNAESLGGNMFVLTAELFWHL